MAETPDGGAVIDRFFDALSARDLVTARECFTADARIWHSFDRISHDLESSLVQWEEMLGMFSATAVVDVRRQQTPGGFVQQHLWDVRAGPRGMAWPVCVVVTIEDGLIARIEEYIDRAGHFDPSEVALKQP